MASEESAASSAPRRGRGARTHTVPSPSPPLLPEPEMTPPAAVHNRDAPPRRPPVTRARGRRHAVAPPTQASRLARLETIVENLATNVERVIGDLAQNAAGGRQHSGEGAPQPPSGHGGSIRASGGHNRAPVGGSIRTSGHNRAPVGGSIRTSARHNRAPVGGSIHASGGHNRAPAGGSNRRAPNAHMGVSDTQLAPAPPVHSHSVMSPQDDLRHSLEAKRKRAREDKHTENVPL